MSTIEVLPSPTTSGIAGRAAWAVASLTFARLTARAIDFCLLILLGRTLSPADFGLVAMAMTLVALLEAISELPVGQAIVRMSNPNREHYDTAFTLSVIRAGVLCATCLAMAWPYARFYGDQRLTSLVCALSLGPVARGLASPRLSHYARNIDFRRDFCCDILGKIMSLVCVGAIALTSASYWAIAAGSLSYCFTSFVASYCLAPYSPRLTLRHVKLFRGFLGWTTAAQIVNAINWQSEKLILGHFVEPGAVGQFSIGSDLSNIPNRLLFAPLVAVLLPAFSLMRHQPERLRASYLRTLRTIAAIGIPALVTLAALADPILSIVLGAKWSGAAWTLKILSTAMIPSMFIAALGPLAMALDQTHLFLRRNLFELAVKLPMLALGAIFGSIQVFLLAVAISAVATNLMSMRLVRQTIDLSIAAQLSAPWRTYLSFLPVTIILTQAPNWIMASGHWQATALALTLMSTGVLQLALSIGIWSVSGRPEGLESLLIGTVGRVLIMVRPKVLAKSVEGTTRDHGNSDHDVKSLHWLK